MVEALDKSSSAFAGFVHFFDPLPDSGAANGPFTFCSSIPFPPYFSSRRDYSYRWDGALSGLITKCGTES